MVNVSRTPKKRRDTPSDDVDDTSILDFMPGNRREQLEKDEDASSKAQTVDLSALQGRIKALEDRNSRLERTNVALLSQSPTVERRDEPQEISFDGLPDPVEDPKGYVKGLQDRIMGSVKQQMSQQNAQDMQVRQDQSRINELWNDFTSRDEYKDLADDVNRVKIATQQVVDRMQSRGLDVNKYMFTTRDLFFEDVKKEYESLFGVIAAEVDDDADDDDDDETPMTRKGKRGTVSDDDDGRSESIFGSIVGSNSSKKGKRAPQGTSMVEDIRQMQEESGIW